MGPTSSVQDLEYRAGEEDCTGTGRSTDGMGYRRLPVLLYTGTWYMVKRAPIYRAGKAVDLPVLCAV
jgi:hypothetical protein